MSEMVERVARAIYDGRNGRGARAWASLPRSHQSPYFLDARAAIEAMREPTGPMVTAGIKDGIEGEGVHAGRRWPAAVTERWQLMIRASLHEGEAER